MSGGFAASGGPAWTDTTVGSDTDINQFAASQAGQGISAAQIATMEGPLKTNGVSYEGANRSTFASGPDVSTAVAAYQQWQTQQNNAAANYNAYTALANQQQGANSTILTGSQRPYGTILGGNASYGVPYGPNAAIPGADPNPLKRGGSSPPIGGGTPQPQKPAFGI